MRYDMACFSVRSAEKVPICPYYEARIRPTDCQRGNLGKYIPSSLGISGGKYAIDVGKVNTLPPLGKMNLLQRHDLLPNFEHNTNTLKICLSHLRP